MVDAKDPLSHFITNIPQLFEWTDWWQDIRYAVFVVRFFIVLEIGDQQMAEEKYQQQQQKKSITRRMKNFRKIFEMSFHISDYS